MIYYVISFVFFWNHCHILSPCITFHWVSQSPRWVPFWWQTLRTSVASWPLENIQVPSNIAMWWRPPRTSPCEGHVLAWSSSNIRTAHAMGIWSGRKMVRDIERQQREYKWIHMAQGLNSLQWNVYKILSQTIVQWWSCIANLMIPFCWNRHFTQ